MVKRGKGKLRTALANHNARAKQRAYEKQKEEMEQKQMKRKLAQPPRPQKSVRPFEKDDTILLVGEGNFSFTLALLSEPHNHPPHQILATSFDTEEEVCQKYPDATDILQQIRARAGTHAQHILAFGVDAGALHKCDAVTGSSKHEQRRWSKVWFGFPHVGAGHKDEQRNVLANQFLLLRFLISVAPYLTDGRPPVYVTGKKHRHMDSDEDESDEEDAMAQGPPASMTPSDSLTTWRPLTPPARQGSVLITIRNASPYTLWNVPALGKHIRSMLPAISATAPSLPKGMFIPSLADVDKNHADYQVWRSFEFVPQEWPGYSHRRTIGFLEGISTSHNEDLLRRSTPHASTPMGRHVGTGECRTYELALRHNT